MIIKDEILKRLVDFKALCQDHKVRYLFAFGSSVTDKFDYRIKYCSQHKMKETIKIANIGVSVSKFPSKNTLDRCMAFKGRRGINNKRQRQW